jgi:RHS repeat-associated protein
VPNHGSNPSGRPAHSQHGNRQTEGGTAASTYSISPSSNRISSISGALARTYAYDAAGNTTGYSTVTATYNNAGRLQTLANGSATETSIYNALGQRIEVSGGATGTVLYAYDEAGHLLGEYDGTGSLIEETVWLGDTPVATLRPNGANVAIYYVHSDQLNTPRQITRPSDNVPMWTWNSDPFGTDAANPNPTGAGAFTFNLRFPGQVFDGQAGLHQNGFRDLDPATGRYVESDPIGLWGGSNTYIYGGGNPASVFDRLGLNCTAVGANVTCSIPGGPTLTFPRPQGWPGSINPSDFNYHKYDIQVDAKCADPASVMEGIINNPTPGTHNPASPAGTPNDATPGPISAALDALDWLSSFGNDPGGYNNNPVLSYVLSDRSGNTYEVNVTQPGHPLFPGYVARGISGGVVHNYGEGAGTLRGPYSPVANAINSVWNSQTQAIVNNSRQRCGCQH